MQYLMVPNKVLEQPVLHERRELILERRKIERRFLREVRAHRTMSLLPAMLRASLHLACSTS